MAEVRLRDLNPAEFDHDMKVVGEVGIGVPPVSTVKLKVAGSLRLDGQSDFTDYGSAFVAFNDSSGHTYMHSFDFTFRTGPNDARTLNTLFLGHDGDISIGDQNPDARLLIRDNGTNSNVLLRIRCDDSSPWGLMINND